MKKYGLQLRIPPGQQKKATAPKAPLPPPAFGFGDDDEDDVEKEISRQASKNKALQKIEEQHKKALEEDPSVFDYDGVYDNMKEQAARPRIQDRTERKSKYIETLMDKAKEREREHEIIYERKLVKERSKDDHLYQDKEKFVTSAYKKQLAERAKWLEEDRLRQIREEKEDVTKKSDLSEFYFGLNKNVAFGARLEESTKHKKQEHTEQEPLPGDLSGKEAPRYTSREREETDEHAERSCPSEHVASTSEVPAGVPTSAQEEKNSEKPLANQAAPEHYKRSEDAVAAARERFLARKRAREQL